MSVLGPVRLYGSEGAGSGRRSLRADTYRHGPCRSYVAFPPWGAGPFPAVRTAVADPLCVVSSLGNPAGVP